MLTYRCLCGNRLFFGNSLCLSCDRPLGFLPEQRELTPLALDSQGVLKALNVPDSPAVKRCANHQSVGCNWLIKEQAPDRLCLACRLTQTIPDLDQGQNRLYWRRLEAAKRYLICDLVRLSLPVSDRGRDPDSGLAIDFLADQTTDAGTQPITTGHQSGRITINIAEADDVHRERQRVMLGEIYRTLLGHLRHESGHYYWMRLIDHGQRLKSFREVFGDERLDYAKALADYYQTGPRPDWSADCISAYASAHPWEDWAETWAHYLHITDAMETARDFGLAKGSSTGSFGQELAHWGELSQALNALSRSVGVADPYPFSITPGVAAKLEFIHGCVEAAGIGGNVANTRFNPSPQESLSVKK